MAASTIEPTKAGYMMIFFVCDASSSSHLSDSLRLCSTTGRLPVASPARIRLTNTLLKTLLCPSMACERVWPPSIDSIRLATTSRKRGCSRLSRRSDSPSRMGTPARASCSRWKQKWMISRRGTPPEANSARLLTGSPLTRSSSMRRRRISRSTMLRASIRPRTARPSRLIAL